MTTDLPDSAPPQPARLDPDDALLGLFPPGTSRDADGVIRVGGVRLDELAADYGTPALIIDEDHLRATARRYREALSARWPNAHVVFASKAFPCTAIYRLVTEEGLWVDVAGAGELAQALQAGADPAHIVMHGNAKTDAEIGQALASRIGLVVIDNDGDVERLVRLSAALGRTERDPQGVLVRILPDVAPPTHEAISTGGAGSKFGLPIEAAAAVMDAVRTCSRLRLDGVHVHIGSQILAAPPFADSVVALADLLDGAALGPFEVYDLGGGLGARYTFDDAPPSIEGYLDALLGAARERLPATATIMIEPGRSLVATSGVSLYTITTLKRTGRTFVAVDGGMGDNLEVSLYGQRFEAALVARACGAQDETCDVVGRHCESGDRLVAGARLPAPAVGDLLAVPATGAYTFTMSNNYNGALRPPVVLVRDGAHRAVVRRETIEDLLRRDVP